VRVDKCADLSRSPQISRQLKSSRSGRAYLPHEPGSLSVWLKLSSPGRAAGGSRPRVAPRRTRPGFGIDARKLPLESERNDGSAPVHVFLNIPYDLHFQDLYLAYIAGLVSLGLYPRATIEIVGGERRLDRIFTLIQTCPYSVHDLSRVELDRKQPETPRFNMPLELGLAVAGKNSIRQCTSGLCSRQNSAELRNP
jgi:hypothetical protein